MDIEFMLPLLQLFLPWAIMIVGFYLGLKLISWARQRRSGAIMIAALLHFVLPDPQVEKTIKLVQQQKRPLKKQPDGNDEAINKR